VPPIDVDAEEAAAAPSAAKRPVPSGGPT
jgi:hypothetical protein